MRRFTADEDLAGNGPERISTPMINRVGAGAAATSSIMGRFGHS
ncbi:MAG: hypothetical protein ACRDNH_00670 [Gaiellaceae bacterium]